MSREWTIADEGRLQQGMTSQVYRQGEVWIGDFSGGIGHEYGSETDPSKQRPVVILSNNEMSSTQIVAICTTKSKYEFDRRAVKIDLPEKYFKKSFESNKRVNSYVLVKHIKSYDTSRFKKYIGKVSNTKLKKINRILIKLTER